MRRRPLICDKPFEKPVYVSRPILPALDEFTEMLEGVWEKEWLTNGGMRHQELERKLSSYLGAPHLSLFNNGTIALITAVQAFNLSGEVITTPFTFPATPHVLSWNGIQPVFADINPETMNIDPRKIEECITNKTTGILGVHVYGTPCDVAAIDEIAQKYGLKVIYDGAHAFGVELQGRPITSFGDATMLSFHATKLFHTAEGGALVVQNESTKNRVDLLKNFGIKNEFQVMMPGINGKMSEIHASMGLCVLKMVDNDRNYRKKIKNIYSTQIKRQEVILPQGGDHFKSSEQYYAIRLINGKSHRDKGVNLRDYVYEKLKSINVYSRKYFYPLCSDYSCYRFLPSSNRSHLSTAYQIAEEVLCLPFHSGLTQDDAQQIAEAINYFIDEASV